MSKRGKPLTDKEGEVRPLTRADFKRARPLSGTFPELAAYSRSRAHKNEPRKMPVQIRLSPEIVDFFKSKGKGWQTRINDTLRAIVEAAR